MKSAQNDMVKKILEVANSEWVRGKVDKNDQKVTVTHANMVEAFKEAYETLRAKTTRLQGEKADFSDEDYRRIAHGAMNALTDHLNTQRTVSKHEPGTTYKAGGKGGGRIIFFQPRAVATPFNRLKKGGVDVINALLKEKGKRKLTAAQGAAIKTSIERHHKETTVGQAQLAIAADVLGRDELFGKKFLRTQAMKDIFEKFGDVTARYDVIRSKGGSKVLDVKNKKEIKLEVKKGSTNFAGSESTDWEHVRPALEEAIAKWAEKQDWANTKGSDSDVELTKKIALYNTVRALVKAGGVAKKPNVRPRIKDSKASKTKKGKGSLSVSTRKASVPRGGAARRQDNNQLLNLVSLINAKLPETVAKNMGPPGLENRTGRFASSARVSDVMPTPQGFPSIGYTYQRDPYQVFELGQGRPPWATQQRDPRKLIDASIREIAAEMIQGRFFTRRT